MVELGARRDEGTVQLGAHRVERWSDGLLDAVALLLATWTVAYHLCLVLRMGTTWALGLTTALVAGSTLLLRRLRTDDDAPASVTIPAEGRTTWSRWATVTVAAAVVAAVGMATGGPWVLVWLPWLVAAGAGAVWALGSQSPDPQGPTTHEEPSGGGGTSALVMAWAVAMALLSVCVRKPNPDDVFYLNLSQWVADHGTFPLRDTLFSDGTYPMANWPPVASYDALVGIVARLTDAYAASIAYQVVPPIAAAMSVLALWRLLRAWRVRWVAVALSVALVFLLETGGRSYAAPGNLFVARLWQGKVILLCLLVPLLLTYALAYLEHPSRVRLARLALAGVASTGLSTTAMFLTPTVALAGMAPVALRSPRKAAAGFAAMAAYPLGAGVVTLALGGHSADDFGDRRLYRFDASWIGHEIFRDGPFAFAAVIAVLLGPLLLTRPGARMTTAVAALGTGLVLVPGLVRLSYEVVGLGPTLWRLSWALTVAALVGVAVVRGAALLRRLPQVRARGMTSWVVPAAGVVAVALLVALGRPPWSSTPPSALATPFHWQRPPSSQTMSAKILHEAGPGDLVLAPEPLAITVAISSTDVRTVAPIAYYITYLRGEAGFHEHERRVLANFSNSTGRARPSVVDRDLRVLGVDIACLNAGDASRFQELRGFGFTPLFSSTTYRCLKSP